MTRDYAQEVRDRMAEIGRLPPVRHDILVEGAELSVCRSIGRGPGNVVQYTYHLAPNGCFHLNKWESDDTITETNTDEGEAVYRFTRRVEAVARWLRREPVDTARLRTLSRWVVERD